MNVSPVNTSAALRRAARRAEALYVSPQFRRSYLAGASAALAGKPIDSCPYKRTRRGWHVWRRAWLRGYESIPERGRPTT